MHSKCRLPSVQNFLELCGTSIPHFSLVAVVLVAMVTVCVVDVGTAVVVAALLPLLPSPPSHTSGHSVWM